MHWRSSRNSAIPLVCSAAARLVDIPSGSLCRLATFECERMVQLQPTRHVINRMLARCHLHRSTEKVVMAGATPVLRVYGWWCSRAGATPVLLGPPRAVTWTSCRCGRRVQSRASKRWRLTRTCVVHSSCFISESWAVLFQLSSFERDCFLHAPSANL